MTGTPDTTGPGALAASEGALSIAALREELQLTQLEFGDKIGLASKAQVSLLERGLAPCSLNVALAIEGLSGGRLDAATLNDDVRRSREAVAEAPAQDAA